jgi:hypothetical protein
MRDLSGGQWAGKQGQDALHLFIELVGLNSSTDDSNSLKDTEKNAQIVRYFFSPSPFH